jgi:hypothetical protein
MVEDSKQKIKLFKILRNAAFGLIMVLLLLRIAIKFYIKPNKNEGLHFLDIDIQPVKEDEYLDSLNKLSSYTYLASLLFKLVNSKVNSVDSTMAFREITASGLNYVKKDTKLFKIILTFC